MNRSISLIDRPVEGYLLIVFVVVLLLFLLNSLFLNYHWKEYGHNPQGIKVGRFIYYLGSAIFIAVIAIGFLIYVKG